MDRLHIIFSIALLLLTFTMGTLLGSVVMLKTTEDRFAAQQATLESNRAILDYLAIEINTANKMCATPIHHYWEAEKEKIISQFQFKENNDITTN